MQVCHIPCPYFRSYICVVRCTLGVLPALRSSLSSTSTIDGGPPTATFAPAGVERSSAPTLGRARPESGTVTHLVDGSWEEEDDDEAEEEEALN